MSGYQQLPVPDMEQWSDEQVLAVYDLCQTISATLMARHEGGLLEKMMASDERRFKVSDGAHTQNLSLPFDDNPV